MTHPLKGADTVRMGTYRNGLNCGRWIKVTIGDWCTGNNGGEAGKAFCTGGTWIPDSMNGASLDVLVFDQCTDGNAWCRDSRYHLDFHTPALGAFRKDGKPAPLAAPSTTPVSMATNWTVSPAFGNRKISWDFEPAPNYQGEPRFWFSVDSKAGYMRVMVTHLPDGIHLLEQLVNGVWTPARMEGDMGQLWILPDPTGTTFQVRIVDASDQLAMGGRTWSLTFPSACGTVCKAAGTPAENVVGTGGVLSKRPAKPRSPWYALSGRGVTFSAERPSDVEITDLTGTVVARIGGPGARASWNAPRAGLYWIRSAHASGRALPLLVP